jgi:hypothetical protein
MCHGAGYDHGCLSEDILAITFVKVDGTLVTYHGAEFIVEQQQTGHFGKLLQISEYEMNFLRGSLGTCGFIYCILSV